MDNFQLVYIPADVWEGGQERVAQLLREGWQVVGITIDRHFIGGLPDVIVAMAYHSMPALLFQPTTKAREEIGAP